MDEVPAPESANNAGAQTSFIPMLSLGIPSNALMALMIGVMIMQGVAPGPSAVTRDPELFWGLIASMWVGNAMLVILNLRLIGIFAGGNLRCAMLLADDDPRMFLTRPISAVLQAIARSRSWSFAFRQSLASVLKCSSKTPDPHGTIACWPESHRRTPGPQHMKAGSRARLRPGREARNCRDR